MGNHTWRGTEEDETDEERESERREKRDREGERRERGEEEREREEGGNQARYEFVYSEGVPLHSRSQQAPRA